MVSAKICQTVDDAFFNTCLHLIHTIISKYINELFVMFYTYQLSSISITSISNEHRFGEESDETPIPVHN